MKKIIVNFGKIKEIFSNFHKTIFSKNEENIHTFIAEYEEILPSFCNGLKKDIFTVKKEISYSINSGFVDGNNNKFKLIKRIVYGKQKLATFLKNVF